MNAACPDVAALRGLLDATLDGTSSATVSEHVGGCSACQAALDALTAGSFHLFSSAFDATPRPEFLDRLKKERVNGPERRIAERPTIPGYDILEELGRGGMGAVYKARHHALHRVVALKVLLGGGRAGAEELARFRTEALVTGRLGHPGVVQVFEVGEWTPPGGGSVPYVCLEFVGGGSLARKIARTPQPPTFAADTVRRIAEAVHAANQQGVVHRDLKPDNVLLDLATGHPKVTDFGLAKEVELGSGHTHTGMILGTPSYMAPEQARGTRAVDARTDVYGLGAILYELLTGHPPFHGPTPLDTVVMVAETDPIPPRQIQPTVPRDLETICLKCLAKEPARRYPTAKALAEDVERFLAGRPIVARPVGPVGRFAKWCRRNPAVAAVSAALAVVVLGSLAGLTWLYLESEAARKQSDIDRQTATNEAAHAQSEQAKAQKAEAGTKAMNDFLVRQVFAAPLPTDKGGLGKNTTVMQMLTAAAPKIEGAFPGQPENEALVHASFGEMFLAYGEFPTAKKHFRLGLELLRGAVPPDDERLTQAKLQFGGVLFTRSEFDEAYPLLDESYRGFRDKFGATDERTLAAQIRTADTLRLLLRHEEAERMVREALKTALTAYDARSEQVLGIKAALSDCFAGQGRREEAEKQYKEVLDGFELNPAYGPDHPQAIVARGRYGFRLLQNKKYVLAEETLKTALEGYRKVFTLEHPSAYTIRGSLGDICYIQGKYREAVEHYAAALAAYRKSQEPHSPLIPFMQGRLGRSLAALGQFEEGERELLAAQQAYEESKVVSPQRRREMVEHLIELYERESRTDAAVKWRAKLETMPKK